ncbi:fibronectin type III domain-containing protein [Blastococcus sp. LR1]|uniref:fibronectin type III domain-containing protein n=1 Tax=Blastococcus sp. LR1 TaxID=2877000 RepID=UPI001CCEDC44|nr:fibronectin type III domain-containing protein [Blastococcus sp. LR1]MCA0144387.1 fibronectin type III domain-containing protein [Blastococcus sp. LR1]
MQQSDGSVGVRRWTLRCLAALLVAATLLLPGTAPLPAPDLRTVSATDPAPPTNVVPAAADRPLNITWTAPAGETTVNGYIVTLDGSEVARPTTTSVTVPGLVNGRGYVVRVTSRSSVLGFPYEGTTPSAPVTGTPRDAVPAAPPTGVTADRGDGRVVLTWTPNTADYDADAYRVMRNSAVASAVLPGRDTATWTDSAVVNDTTYSYAVQTRDTSGNWSASSSPAVSATPTDLTPPAAPTGLIGGRGDARAGLSWNASPEPDLAGYRLLRDGVEVAALTGTEHIDLGLANDRTYVYTLVAVDTHGNRSAPSASVSVTPTDLTPPATPTGLTAVRGDGEVFLSWTANPEPDLAAYRLFRDGVLVATVPGATTSYVDGGLTNDTTYRYTLVAVDTHGNASVSSAAVPGTPTDLGAPASPTGLAAVRGDGRVTLTWTANGEPDLAGYRVLRDGVEIATVTSTTYTDTGLTNDRVYAYALVAVDTHGNRSPATAPVSATPTDLTPPATPTGLTAVRGDGRVTLTWTANSEPDRAGYRVFRDGVEIAAVAGTTYTDIGLTNDTTYRYTLVAVDTHDNRSTPSAQVSATPTDLTPPAAPTGLDVARASGNNVLTWTANTEPDLAGYRVLRDGVEIATVTSPTFTDGGGASRSYAIVAIDTHGNRSAASAPVTSHTDVTPPAVPTGLTATRGDARVTLSWTANVENDLASYRVLRNGVEIATVTGTSYVATGLTNDVSYSFSLVAVDDSGNRSAASATVSATPTDLTAPARPTGFAAVRGDGRVTLTWNASPEPDLASYRVFRNGTEIATVTGTSYVAAGLTNDVAYSFSLVAVDTHGNRSPATAAVSATPTDLTAPATPTGLTAVRGERQVALTWNANPEPDLASYRVFRNGTEIATVTGTSYTATGLTNDVTYSFSLVAVDTHGNRSPATAALSATPTDLTAPATPTGFSAVRGEQQVALSWTANPESDLASYQVFQDGVEIATVTGTGYVATGLTNDVAYSFSLVAVDTHGNRSPATAAVTATPTDLTAPATPTGLTTTTGEGRIPLSWTANSESDLAGYRVFQDGVEIATVTGTGYVATGLTNDVTYSFSLVAVDTHGNRSLASAAVPGTPRDLAPASPTDVTAAPGDRRAVLAWTPPADPDVVTYRVLAEDGAVLATASAPATQIAVSGLTNGTTYRLRVVAVDAGGNVSAPSAEVSVVPVSPRVPAQGAGDKGGAAVSADGRHVVIGTSASLEPGDTNTAYELYLLDRTAGTARRLAPLPAGATGATDPTNTSAPAISADGGTVVLATTAPLVAADTNTLTDVYRFDVASSAWSLVSVPPAGRVSSSSAGAVLQTGSSVYSTSPPVAITADGDLVLFYSARSDLVAGDSNGVVDLFAKRLSTGTVTRVSTTTEGANLGGAATGPALEVTPDGRFALFPATTSTGTVLLYRKTLSGPGAGELVVASSVTSRGTTTRFGVYRDAGDIALSDDGRYVALVTVNRIATTNPAATSTAALAYRVDLTTSTAIALGDGQQTGWEHQVELDPTGRYAFYSTAEPALPADTNGHTDHYRRDLAGGVAGPLLLVTSDADGRPTSGPVGSVAPAEYGRLTAFSGDRVVLTTSQALVSADTNRIRDLYLKDLGTGVASSPLG